MFCWYVRATWRGWQTWRTKLVVGFFFKILLHHMPNRSKAIFTVGRSTPVANKNSSAIFMLLSVMNCFNEFEWVTHSLQDTVIELQELRDSCNLWFVSCMAFTFVLYIKKYIACQCLNAREINSGQTASRSLCFEQSFIAAPCAVMHRNIVFWYLQHDRKRKPKVSDHGRCQFH